MASNSRSARVAFHRAVAFAAVERLESRQLLTALTEDPQFEFSGTQQQIVYKFDADVRATFNVANFTLNDLIGDGAVIDPNAMAVTFSTDGHTATVNWNNLASLSSPVDRAHPAKTLATGKYRAVLNGSALSLSSDSVYDFDFIRGDINGDKTCNFDELLILAQHYNTTTGAHYDQGDFDYSGSVDFGDLLYLAQVYNGPVNLPSSNANTLGIAFTSNEIVKLVWTPPGTAGYDQFRVERSLDGTVFNALPGAIVAAQSGTQFYTYIDDTVADGSKYWYRVVPVDTTSGSSTFGDWTPTVKKSALTVLPMPMDLRAEAISATSVDLSWIDDANSETTFWLYVSDNGGEFIKSSITIPPHSGDSRVVLTIPNLEAGHTYRFAVAAKSVATNSARTQPVTVVTPDSEAEPLSISGQSSIAVGSRATFSASGGGDPGNSNSLTYIWRASKNGVTLATSSGTQFSFDADAVGQYVITATTIQVNAQPRSAIATLTASALPGQQLPLTGPVTAIVDRRSAFSLDGSWQQDPRVRPYLGIMDEVEGVYPPYSFKWFSRHEGDEWVESDGFSIDLYSGSAFFKPAEAGAYDLRVELWLGGEAILTGQKRVDAKIGATNSFAEYIQDWESISSVMGHTAFEAAELPDGSLLVVSGVGINTQDVTWGTGTNVGAAPVFAAIYKLDRNLQVDETFASSLVMGGVDQTTMRWDGTGDGLLWVTPDHTLVVPGQQIGSGAMPYITHSPTQIAVQSDGKFLVAAALAPVNDVFATGSGDPHFSAGWLVSRYKANGSIDADFGDQGYCYIPDEIGENINTGVDRSLWTLGNMVIAPDDESIWLVGSAVDDDSGFRHAGVAVKITSEGDIDESFGEDGVKYVHTTSWSSNFRDVTFQLDSEEGYSAFLVGASSRAYGIPTEYQAGIYIAKMNGAGELDEGFGDYGTSTYIGEEFFSQYETTDFGIAGNNIRIDSDGKILVGGAITGFYFPLTYYSIRWTSGGVVARFLPNGDIDTTFGMDFDDNSVPDGMGAVLNPYGDGYIDQFVLPSGGDNDEIYFVGAAADGGLLGRFTANGVLDTSFGDGGTIMAGEYDGGEGNSIPEGLGARWNGILYSAFNKDFVLVGGLGSTSDYTSSLDHQTIVVRYNPRVPGADDLTATLASDGSVDLAWVRSSGGEEGFEIRRALSEATLGSTSSAIARVGAGSTTFRDVGVADNTTYYYKVYPIYSDDEGDLQLGDAAGPASVTTRPAATGTVLQDIIEVPVGGSDISSHIALTPGEYYEITASGYFQLSWNNIAIPATMQHADAEYGYLPNEWVLTPGINNHVPRDVPQGAGTDYGVSIRPVASGETVTSTNGGQGATAHSSVVDSNKYPYWGLPSESASYGYTIGYVLEGETARKLVFRYHDSYYPDNAVVPTDGNTALVVKIYRAIPNAPVGVVATANREGKRIDLAWANLATDGKQIVVERAMGSGAFTQIATLPGSATEYADTAVSFNAAARYRLKVVNEFAESVYSNEAVAVLVNDAPVVTVVSEQIVHAGEEFIYQVDAVDPDGDSEELEYSVTAAGLTNIAISDEGVISGWVPDVEEEDYTVPKAISVAVTDKDGAVSYAVIYVTVAPLLTSIPKVAIPIAQTDFDNVSGTVDLSVLGSDDGPESGLTYTWSVVKRPRGSPVPTFNVSGNNAAKDTRATVDMAGVYRFRVTISDGTAWTAYDEHEVEFTQVFSSIELNSVEATIEAGGDVSFNARLRDQFERSLTATATYSWQVTAITSGYPSEIGAISPTSTTNRATYVADSTLSDDRTDSVAVTATVNGVSHTDSVVVFVLEEANEDPEINPYNVDAEALNFSQLRLTAKNATDDDGEDNLIYIWTVEPKPGVPQPSFSINGTNAAKTTILTCDPAHDLDYVITLEIRDQRGGSVITVLTVDDDREFETIRVISQDAMTSPTSTLVVGEELTLSVSPSGGPINSAYLYASARDQYGRLLVDSASLNWTWTINGSPATPVSGHNEILKFDAPTSLGSDNTYDIVVQAQNADDDWIEFTTVIRVIGQEPPILKITSPAMSDEDTARGSILIRSSTDIKIVADDPNPGDPVSWYLWITPRGGERQLLASSANQRVGHAPSTGAKAYSINPAVWDDGLYTLAITGTTSTSEMPADSRTIEIRSLVKMGGLNLPFTDFEYTDDKGNSVTVTRVYDSTKSAEKGTDFGYGWRLEITDSQLRTSSRKSEVSGENYDVLRYGDLVYITLPTGEKHTFQFLPKPQSYRVNGNPANPLDPRYSMRGYLAQFVAVDGSRTTLTTDHADLDDGIDSEDYNLYYVPDYHHFVIGLLGSPDVLRPTLQSFTSNFVFKSEDGTTTRFNAVSGKAIDSTDANGNTTTYSDDSLSGPVSVVLDRFGSSDGVLDGLIKEIHLQRGGVDIVPSIRYEYNDPDDTGDSNVPRLRAVRDSKSNVIKYAYTDTARPNSLTEITDPQGVRILKVNYDPASGEVVRMEDASGARANLATTPLTTTGTTRSTRDASGNTTELIYNEQGDVVREIKPIRNNDGAIVKYLVTVHEVKYDSWVQDILEDTELGGSPTNRLLYQIDWSPFEVPVSTSGRDRYTDDPSVHSVKLSERRYAQASGVDNPASGDFGYLSTDTQYDANGGKVVTTYSAYQLGKPSIVKRERFESNGSAIGDATFSYFKYDQYGNLEWTIGENGEGSRYVYSRGNAGLNNGLLLATYKVKAENFTPGTLQTITSLDSEIYYFGSSTGEFATAAPESTSAYYVNNLDAVSGEPDSLSTMRVGARGKLKATTDRNGRITSYVYDNAGRTVLTASLWVNPDSGQAGRWIVTRTQYNGDGQAIASYEATYADQTSGTGKGELQWSMSSGSIVVNESSYAAERITGKTYYDKLGRPFVTLDATNAALSSGRKATVQFYDARGNVYRTIYPDGTETRSAFDENGRLAWTTDRFVSTATISITFVDADTSSAFAGTASVAITSEDNTTTANATRTLYDSAGRTIGTERYRDVIIPVAEDSQAANLYKSVVPSANLLIIAGKRLSATATVFDNRGRVAESVNVDGLRTGTYYYPNGQPKYSGVLKPTSLPNWFDTTMLNASAVFDSYTEYAYDQPVSSGDLTAFPGAVTMDETISPGNIYSQTFKDQLGRVIGTRIKNPAQTAVGPIDTHTVYRATGEEVETDLTEDIELTDYDLAPDGQHTVKFDAEGHETHYVYDGQGRLTDVWLPPIDDATDSTSDLKWSHWHYVNDVNGNQVSQTDPRGKVTSFVYDDHGRRTSRTLPSDGNSATSDTETWTYDAQGRLLTHVDFKEQSTKYIYDDTASAGGRLVEEQRFTGEVDSTPDEKTAYGYDALGRQDYVGEYSLVASVLTLGRTETTTFDAVTGQVASVTTPEGTINYAYDSKSGRKVRMWTTRSGTTNNDTIYSYDSRGRLEKTTALVLNGVRYGTYAGLDASGNPATPTDNPAISTPVLTTTNVFNVSGSLDLVTLPNGSTEDYVYDGLNRLDQVVVVKNSSGLKLFEQDYVLLNDGQRDYVIEKRYDGTSSTPTSNVKIDWTYDAQNHLVKEIRDTDTTPGTGGDNFGTQDSGTSDYIDEYKFDLSGNRVVKDHNAATGADEIITSSYTDRDQLWKEDSSTNGTGVDRTYGYDANGSLASKTYASGVNNETYTWDPRNRMKNATVGGVVTAFTYDASGVRVSKLVGTTESDRIFYLNDKQNPTGYAKAVEEYTSAGLVRSYILSLDVVGKADTGDSTNPIKLFVKDGHGATRALVSALQTILQVYEYDAYSNLLNLPANSALTEWLAPDGRRDASTGLDYNLARYVDRQTGQFISYDSFEADPASPANLHKYTLLQANPQNGIDPTGHFTLTEIVTNLGNAVNTALRVLRPVSKAYNSFNNIMSLFDTAKNAWEIFNMIRRALAAGGAGFSASLINDISQKYGLATLELSRFNDAITGATNELSKYWNDFESRVIKSLDDMLVDVTKGAAITAPSFFEKGHNRKTQVFLAIDLPSGPSMTGATTGRKDIDLPAISIGSVMLRIGSDARPGRFIGFGWSKSATDQVHRLLQIDYQIYGNEAVTQGVVNGGYWPHYHTPPNYKDHKKL